MSIPMLEDPTEEHSASLYLAVYKCSFLHTVISALKKSHPSTTTTILLYSALEKPQARKAAGIKKNRSAQVRRLTQESLKQRGLWPLESEPPLS